MAEAAQDITDEIEETQDTGEETVWPEDWRQRIAGEDEKELSHIGKYATPKDIWTKARSLEQQLSSGEYKKVVPYPEEGSDEDKVNWLKDNGIPESPKGYELKRELDDEARAPVDEFLEFAHERRIPNTVANDVVDYFFQRFEKDQEVLSESDKALAEKTEDTLRAEWEGEYRLNMNKIDALVSTAPKEVQKDFMEARLPDGSRLRDNASAMKFLLNAALALNPTTTVVAGGGDQMSAIEDRIEEIRGKMNTTEYKKPGSKLRKEYMDLVAVRDGQPKA